jgi:hypothetical protein
MIIVADAGGIPTLAAAAASNTRRHIVRSQPQVPRKPARGDLPIG